MLKAKKPKLTMIPALRNIDITPLVKAIAFPIMTICPLKYAIRKNRNASTRLVNGPATPTNAAPHSPPLTLSGRNGTGLAPPNIGVLCVTPFIITSKAGNAIVKTGSICLTGLRVRRPFSFAVSSPSQYAVNPCISSCSTIDPNTTANTMIRYVTSISIDLLYQNCAEIY